MDDDRYRMNDMPSGSRCQKCSKTINITNITNVTNVTAINGVPCNGHRRRKRVKKFRHGERPPKLTRFCASCGLLDYDVAARMSDGEMAGEAAKVTSYAARGLAGSVGNMYSSVERGVFGIAKSFFGIIGSLLKL